MGTRLFVGNLPYDATEEALRACMEGAGPVARVSVMRDRETGRSRGFAFVDMEAEEGALRAIQQLNGAPFAGRRITVKEARPPEEGARPPLRDRRDGGSSPTLGPRRDAGAPAWSAPRSASTARPPLDQAPASSSAAGLGPARPPSRPAQRSSDAPALDDEAGGGRRGQKRRDGAPKWGGGDWDRPRRGRPREMAPPPAKHRLRAWEIDEEGEEEEGDEDEFDLSAWGEVEDDAAADAGTPDAPQENADSDERA